MYKILNNHNRRRWGESNQNNERTDRVPRNCKKKKKDECLLDRRCHSVNEVYHASMSLMEHSTDSERVYIGISEGIGNRHWHSFSNPRLWNQTALSKYFWSLKKQGLTLPPPDKVEKRQCSTTNSFNGRCNLCIEEKISIINFQDPRLLLNRGNELIFKCRHKCEFRLTWSKVIKSGSTD